MSRSEWCWRIQGNDGDDGGGGDGGGDEPREMGIWLGRLAGVRGRECVPEGREVCALLTSVCLGSENSSRWSPCG